MKVPTFGLTLGLCLAVLFFFINVQIHAQVEICQANCASSDRLTGPEVTPNTRPHPWNIAPFPNKNFGFCQMGCQLFFSEFPYNVTCKRLCDFTYRYDTKVGYSDLNEQAISECRDGCDIALQVCQAGYFCNDGRMTVCAPGSYRESVSGVSIEQLSHTKECTLCPPGRYRAINKGKSANDCTLCPVGKYANVLGSVLVSDCKRCPAGKNAEERGKCVRFFPNLFVCFGVSVFVCFSACLCLCVCVCVCVCL